jgi:hypothetical protein
LTLDERNDVNEVGKSIPLNLLEQMSVGQEPLLSGGSLKLEAANVFGMEDRGHAVPGSAERFTELLPVPAEFSQLHQWLVSDEPQWTVSSDKCDGNIERVVPVCFSAFSSSTGQFRRIGDVHSFDAVTVSVDKPLNESHGFDRHPSGPGQSVNPVFDFSDTLGVDGQRTDDGSLGSTARNGGFVQVNANERSKFSLCDSATFDNSFTLFCCTVLHNKLLEKRLIK